MHTRNAWHQFQIQQACFFKSRLEHRAFSDSDSVSPAFQKFRLSCSRTSLLSWLIFIRLLVRFSWLSCKLVSSVSASLECEVSASARFTKVLLFVNVSLMSRQDFLLKLIYHARRLAGQSLAVYLYLIRISNIANISFSHWPIGQGPAECAKRLNSPGL